MSKFEGNTRSHTLLSNIKGRPGLNRADSRIGAGSRHDVTSLRGGRAPSNASSNSAAVSVNDLFRKRLNSTRKGDNQLAVRDMQNKDQ